jgi:N-alpha-acetyl-L-2,4-diaminobutyrate deacetylase
LEQDAGRDAGGPAHERKETPMTALDPAEAPLEAVRFLGLAAGPRLIVLGAVHGNEVCGAMAIERAIADCRTGTIAIRRGEVTFVPVTNRKAFHQKTREGDRNLNRDLGERLVPRDYEDRIGAKLCTLLRTHDVLLDLHSFRSEGDPFAFLGPTDNTDSLEPFRHAAAEWDFTARLGAQTLIHGWLPAYSRYSAERVRLGHAALPLAEGFGTTEYMRFAGGYAATLECGQHDDPAAPGVAYAAILNALATLGIVDALPPARAVRHAVELHDVIVCEAEGDQLAGKWRTGDAVAEGELIVRRKGGAEVRAPRQGYLVFPNPRALPGELFAYFGIPSDRL